MFLINDNRVPFQHISYDSFSLFFQPRQMGMSLPSQMASQILLHRHSAVVLALWSTKSSNQPSLQWTIWHSQLYFTEWSVVLQSRPGCLPQAWAGLQTAEATCESAPARKAEVGLTSCRWKVHPITGIWGASLVASTTPCVTDMMQTFTYHMGGLYQAKLQTERLLRTLFLRAKPLGPVGRWANFRLVMREQHYGQKC